MEGARAETGRISLDVWFWRYAACLRWMGASACDRLRGRCVSEDMLCGLPTWLAMRGLRCVACDCQAKGVIVYYTTARLENQVPCVDGRAGNGTRRTISVSGGRISE